MIERESEVWKQKFQSKRKQQSWSIYFIFHLFYQWSQSLFLIPRLNKTFSFLFIRFHFISFHFCIFFSSFFFFRNFVDFLFISIHRIPFFIPSLFLLYLYLSQFLSHSKKPHFITITALLWKLKYIEVFEKTDIFKTFFGLFHRMSLSLKGKGKFKFKFELIHFNLDRISDHSEFWLRVIILHFSIIILSQQS